MYFLDKETKHLSLARTKFDFLIVDGTIFFVYLIFVFVRKKTILSREASLLVLKNNGVKVVEGANLIANEYGSPLFADFFFFITGFHGFHVFSGVIINIIIFLNVIMGTYERRGHYEMVEKVGLYWHFVDLVWVFVFTFFYLV